MAELDLVLRIAKRYFSGRGDQYDIDMFASWIEAKKMIILEDKETCPKCNLEPGKQMGGIPCNYCGMIGLMPWGG